MNEKEIETYISETIKNNTLNKINNIYLSNKQIDILNKYKIDYKNVVDINELIYKIEVYIEDNYYGDELFDLENLSLELSEFNYYYNTNK